MVFSPPSGSFHKLHNSRSQAPTHSCGRVWRRRTETYTRVVPIQGPRHQMALKVFLLPRISAAVSLLEHVRLSVCLSLCPSARLSCFSSPRNSPFPMPSLSFFVSLPCRPPLRVDPASSIVPSFPHHQRLSILSLRGPHKQGTRRLIRIQKTLRPPEGHSYSLKCSPFLSSADRNKSLGVKWESPRPRRRYRMDTVTP